MVVITFAGTIGLGRAMGLPGHQPVLVASGFSICGASAIGAMAATVRAKEEEQAVPIALVTLCGTLAIAVLPALWHPLGSRPRGSATGWAPACTTSGRSSRRRSIAGPAALAVAVVVKLTRVLMLAPMVAITAAVERRRAIEPSGPRPAIVPLFIAGFLAAVLLNTFVPLPEWLLTGADVVQTALLATALFALGASIRVAELVHTGWRALVVGLTSWVLVAALAYGAVLLG